MALKHSKRIDSTIELPRRLVMRISAHEKDGKTHFGLTAPPPIGVMNIDRGLEGVVEKFAKVKEIHVSDDFRACQDMPVVLSPTPLCQCRIRCSEWM